LGGALNISYCGFLNIPFWIFWEGGGGESIFLFEIYCVTKVLVYGYYVRFPKFLTLAGNAYYVFFVYPPNE
jgi:hypothetical protein